MSSTFGILETAKSGLSVAMQNLTITGHNIANADTEGYTRQRLITSAKEIGSSVYLISPTSDSTVGQGVEVLDIQQIRSGYLDDQYRDEYSSYSYSEYTTQSLSYLETLFNGEMETDEGLTGAIEDFFDALNDFASDTTSESNRVAVQSTAESLTENFNLVYEEMEDLWNDQNDSISSVADEINSIAQQIAALNKSIASYERSGDTANDLRDERNLLLDELSGYVNITYGNNEDNTSMVDVEIGGISLVSGTDYNTIEVNCAADDIDDITAQIAAVNTAIEASGSSATSDQTDALNDLVTQLNSYITVSTTTNSDGSVDVSYNGTSLVSGSETTSISDATENDLDAWISVNSNTLTLGGSELSIEAGTVEDGELCAHMEQISSTDSSDPGIPYYMQQLNGLAQTIAESINAIHTAGYTYDTTEDTATTSSVTGVNFFDVPTVDNGDGTTSEDYSSITAGNFSVSDEIAESVWNIAGSSVQVYSDGTTMDSGNNDVASELYAALDDNGYYDRLDSIVGHLAIAMDTSQSILDTKQSLVDSIDNQRQSVSSVSTDEETTNLIVYQQAYNACARVITAIDEMLDTMINGMGTVGL